MFVDVELATRNLDWDQAHALPPSEYRGDIHCVTTWSKLGTSFSGVLVDERCRTSLPDVYAAGDVIGNPALASAAISQNREMNDRLRLILVEHLKIGLLEIRNGRAVRRHDLDVEPDLTDLRPERRRLRFRAQNEDRERRWVE